MMRINIDDTEVDDGLRYLYQDRPFTGELIETDRDGRIISSKTVLNGISHGPEFGWYSDGTLEIEIQIADGVAVGTSRRWHRNGRLAEERDFNGDGRLVAVRRWPEDGSTTAAEETGGIEDGPSPIVGRI